MPYDDRWLADLLAKGQVRLVGPGVAGDRGRDTADTPDIARPHLSEKGFQDAVLRVAREQGWLCYHTYDSRRSPSGFPDLVLVRGPAALFCELKVPGGVVTLAQQRWLEMLGQVERVEAVVWVPEMWEDIVERLRA